MASSIPSALDYLVTQIAALALPDGAVVSDGWPSSRSDTLITVGIEPDSGDSDLTVTYSGLDSSRDEEEVELTIYIWARRAGAGAASAARQVSVGIYDQIRDLVRQDRRLGGAVVPGLPARVARWTLSQTVDIQEAGEGRGCAVTMVLEWRHRG